MDASERNRSSPADDYPSDDGTRDGRVEEAVARYADRLIAGERVEAHEILKAHPDVGREVLHQLEAFVAAPSVSEKLELGTVGDYVLRRQIGRGGMGVVYEAWQSSMERRVALKVLPPGVAADERAFQRFMREARTAGKLNHQNIVAVHAMGVDDDTPYYAMEYVAGETLAQVLARLTTDDDAEREAALRGFDDLLASRGSSGAVADGGDRSVDATASRTSSTRSTSGVSAQFCARLAVAFAEVADGLHHAHVNGVVHRDVKPSNLILDGDARLRILDFGLARFEGQESLTRSGDFVGTPLYMSPEQARRRKVPIDHRTDIYSLGATLYEVLTLKPPFRGRDHHDTLSQIITRDPRPPRQTNDAVPRDLETIVLKCLCKEPRDRYATAEALAQDLRRFVRGEAIEARQQSPWERFGRHAWRLRWALGASGAGCVAALAVLTVSLGIIWAEKERTLVERDVARRNYYIAEIHLARQAWEDDETGRLDAILDRQAPAEGERDWRGWEWYFLKTAARLPVVLRGHTAAVTDVAWDPDGTRLASASEDGTVRIWHPGDESADPLVLVGHRDIVPDIDWSPDGTRVVSGSRDGIVFIWDAVTGEHVLAFKGHTREDSHSGVHGVAWRSDGSEVATASSDNTVRVFDADTGDERLSLKHDRWALSVAWADDGMRLASTQLGGIVIIWDTRTGEEIHRLGTLGERNPMSSTDVAWSPDGDRLSVANEEGLALWDAVRGEQVTILALEGQISALSWSRVGGLLTSNWEDGWVVWDIDAGERIESSRGHAGSIDAVDWSPDGQCFATGGSDRLIKVWTLDPPPTYHDLDGRATDVAWSRNGDLIAALAGDDGVRIWEAESGELVRPIDYPGNDVDWSPDGQRVVVASSSRTSPQAKVWSVRTGKEILTLSGHEKVLVGVSWSPDGSRIATSSHDRTARIWDASSGDPLTVLEGHRLAVFGRDWHPAGRLLATGGYDRALRVWDVETGETIHSVEGHWPIEVRWSPDGERLVSASYDGFARVWTTRDWELEHELEGHVGAVVDIAWSPDGTRLASGGGDRYVRIWDVESGQEVMAIGTGDDAVRSLAWSPLGDRLAVSFGETLRILDATPGLKRAERSK